MQVSIVRFKYVTIMDFINISVSKNIGTIIFNNDKQRNSLNLAMLDEIIEALDVLEKENVRVIIIRSNPNAKVWCAGLNIKELPKPGRDPLPYSHPLEVIIRKIELLSAPVIAMVTGTVWGGGTDLVLTCDIIIGSPKSSFAITPAKLGLPYNSKGLEHFLNTLPLNIIKEMFFTALPLNADRSYNIGLLNHLINDDEIEVFVYDMAESIVNNSPFSIKVVKEQLNLLTAARPLTPDVFERINELRIMAYNSEDFKEGLQAFCDKRKPIFLGK